MGLFDFLKPKQATAATVKPASVNRQECDISKTYIVAELLKVGRNKKTIAGISRFIKMWLQQALPVQLRKH